MPPTLDGVGPSCVGLPAGPWATITDFLLERFPAVGPEVWLQRMAQQRVVDEWGELVTPTRAYRPHMRVYYYRALAAEPTIPFEATVLFQDEHLVVADKPHFLPVTPSGSFLQETLLVRLKNLLGLHELVPIHRIDRETAGLVLFSVRAHERDAYQGLFRKHQVRKHYLAVAPHRDLDFPLERRSRIVQDEPFFRQRETDGAPNSHTHVALQAKQGELGLYALSPVTGKKHQLRVHMNALGLPIVNDRMYPPVPHTPEDDFAKPLQLLAKSIAFTDPLTGQARYFESQRRLDWV